jgi:hypothetical protein
MGRAKTNDLGMMPKKQGSRNYSAGEQLRLLAEVDRILPTGQADWEAVRMSLNTQEKAGHPHRDVRSLKRKFASLCRAYERTDAAKRTQLHRLAHEAKCRVDGRFYRSRYPGESSELELRDLPVGEIGVPRSTRPPPNSSVICGSPTDATKVLVGSTPLIPNQDIASQHGSPSPCGDAMLGAWHSKLISELKSMYPDERD